MHRVRESPSPLPSASLPLSPFHAPVTSYSQGFQGNRTSNCTRPRTLHPISAPFHQPSATGGPCTEPQGPLDWILLSVDNSLGGWGSGWEGTDGLMLEKTAGIELGGNRAQSPASSMVTPRSSCGKPVAGSEFHPERNEKASLSEEWAAVFVGACAHSPRPAGRGAGGPLHSEAFSLAVKSQAGKEGQCRLEGSLSFFMLI